MNGRKVSIVLILLVFTSSFSFSLMILPENVRAQTLYVGGPGPGNHTSIQDAINASFPGDTVFVYNGTYLENVIVSKSISLTGEGRDVTTIDGGETGPVVNITSDWVNVTGFTITNGGSGIWEDALSMWYSSNCRVEANNISSNRRVGIFVRYSSNTTIHGNVVSRNLHGIYVSESNDNIITDNVASNNSGYGILIGLSNRHYLSGNTLSDNEIGIYLSTSTNAVLKDNSMVNDGMQIASGGWFDTLNTHDIDTSNTVNGKPVIYWKNTTGGTIPPDAGQIFLVNSTDVLIENVNISRCYSGVKLAYTSRIVIANLSISDVSWAGVSLDWTDNVTIVSANVSGTSSGIFVGYGNDNTTIVNSTGKDNLRDIDILASDHTTIANNTLSGYGWGVYFRLTSRSNVITNNTIISEEDGMYLHWTLNSTVSGNNISSSSNNGIELSYSHGNSIFNNTMWMNLGYGMRLEGSNDNKIHHNRFYGNGQNAYDDSDTSQWDNSYPSGGNYWSDYTGIDIKSGPDQTLPGSDGIGDVPYEIDVDSRDRFPLMDPFGVINAIPVASFTVSPSSGSIDTIFDFDASSTSDLEDSPSVLEVRWDWEDDGSWDISWSTTKTNQHQYTSLGTYTVRLEVMDTGGLINTTTRQVSVVNTPPVASFEIAPSYGDTSTMFEVDASWSSDLEDSTTALEARWDWEDEGVWDTAWSTTKMAQHQYSSPGVYTIHLEIRDTGGLTSNETLQVNVTAIIENSPPDCSIVAPTHGETLFGITTVEGLAYDEENSDLLVEIRIDSGSWMIATGSTSWVYRWNMSTVNNGNHTIYARAYDGELYSTVASVSVIVNNPVGPTDDDNDDDDTVWTTGIVVLVAVGVLFVIILLLFMRKRRGEEEEESELEPPEDSEGPS